jgi:hypothetical protein
MWKGRRHEKAKRN